MRDPIKVPGDVQKVRISSLGCPFLWLEYLVDDGCPE